MKNMKFLCILLKILQNKASKNNKKILQTRHLEKSTKQSYFYIIFVVLYFDFFSKKLSKKSAILCIKMQNKKIAPK